MPQRYSPAEEALQNQAFLEQLKQTGNARLAAERVGISRYHFFNRRKRSPAFKALWDGVLIAVEARLKLAGGTRLPEATSGKRLKTKGGEIKVARGNKGRVQIRRAHPGRLTLQGEQTFLAALASTANVRLAAAAAGVTHTAMYHRRRHDAVFARQWDDALRMGHDRLEWALTEAAIAGLDPQHPPERELWIDAAAHTPIPPMTVPQAIQLAIYHCGTAALGERRIAHNTRTNMPIERVRDAVLSRAAALTRGEHFKQTGEWRFPTNSPHRPSRRWSKSPAGPAASPARRWSTRTCRCSAARGILGSGSGGGVSASS